ncbi:MAG TPA: hypothetical protein VI750_08060 [Pyrinomonadaceae bacterium]|nr:hypothetical protein [Pyrinomonadaceae bacterium]
MNRKTFPFVIMLGVLLPLTVTYVNAQTSHELVANIPFSFTVCREQLPAGKYKVRPITSASTNLLLVRNEDNRSAEIVCTQDIHSTRLVSPGKLIFNRYGDQYFLSELWFPGEKTGNQLVKSERGKRCSKS